MSVRIPSVFPAVIGIFALLGGLFALPFGAQNTINAQTTPQTPLQRTVSVSGSGASTVQPDQAFVVLGVQSEAETASEALNSNSDQMEALMTALRGAGIAAADIRTRTVQLYPRYSDTATPTTQQEGEAQNRITGYTAVNTVEVTIREMDNLGTLLDAAVEAGSNQIESIRFDVETPGALADQARETAFNDAQRKATQLATLAGATLGRVVSINETSFYPMPYQQEAMAMDRAAAAVPISPGTQTVTVDVQVTFELIYEEENQ